MDILEKQPGDALDFNVRFDRWLPCDDTITTVEAVVDVPSEVNIDSLQYNGQTVTVWISGGLTGKTYKVTVTVATAVGRIKESEFKLRVREL
jgi:hypothetical protein